MYSFRYIGLLVFYLSFACVVSANDENILIRLKEIEKRLVNVERLENENDELKLKLENIQTENNDLKLKLKNIQTDHSKKFKEIEDKLTKCDICGRNLGDMLKKKLSMLERLVTGQNDLTYHSAKNSFQASASSFKESSEGLRINQGNKTVTTEQTVKIVGDENNLDKRDSSFDKRSERGSLKKEYPRKRGMSGLTDKVAFMAVLSRSVNNLGYGQIIAFPQVLLNEANAYSGSDGIFICPQSGLYLFSYNIFLGAHTGSVAFCGVQFKVNGHPYYESYESSFDEHEVENAGATFVVRLNAGDHVWIASNKSGTQLHAGKTYFMGVLLME